MARQLEFQVDGPINTTILIEEEDFDGDGFSDLRFTVTADTSGGETADLRGLFWDVETSGLLAQTSVWSPGSPDVTDSQFSSNGVVDLGGGANMSGSITSGGRRFDAGVEIGTQGIGDDDIQSTTFVLRASGTDLTLDEIGGQRFGVRYTSVGDVGGSRNDSLKLTGVAPNPPVANDDDAFFVEFGDSALIDVLANDTDADGDLDPSTLAVGGADLGTATNEGGQLRYVADPIAYDATNSSADDALTYTVEDDDGILSNTASVTAKVIDPLRETDSDSALAPNGQEIGLSLSTEDRTFNTSSFVEVDIATGAVGQDVNVSFVIDGSGSVGAPNYTQEIAAVQNAINDLRAEYTGSASSVQIQLVQFSSGASSASYGLFDAALDNVTTGTPLTP